MLKQVLFLIGVSVFFVSCKDDKPEEPNNYTILKTEVEQSINMKYGVNLEDYIIQTDSVRKNDYLSTILEKYGVSYQVVDQIAKNYKEVFDIRKIRPNRPYHVLFEKNQKDSAKYFVYENSEENYVFFALRDSIYVHKGSHPITYKVKEASGVINSSLSMTMQNENLPVALALELSDIYAWTIDFYRLQKGDFFKVIYEEKYIEDQPIGLGKIIAADFNHGGEDFYSYLFTNDSVPSYFDEHGGSLKKSFLKSPLKFSRISSRYSKRRFHPVLKRFKSHLGTDYAAPTGTPILAVGDGTVIESRYKRNNGNYVKIRHNSTYTTQYLHMSKRLVKVGQVVRQGQTIGLVGSTGLATGPHVCFRFWKNGAQVNHLKEKFPPSTPVKPENMEEYKAVIDSLSKKVDSIPLKYDQKTENVVLSLNPSNRKPSQSR